ncbi:MAG: hemolysin III family protein [Roseburia sp.]|nr:hemolysin III family protein [Roseburia sp.]
MSKTKVMQTQIAYSRSEELTNIITHAIGAALSFVGLVFLMLKAVSGDISALGVISVFLYGFAVTSVLAASALYHAMPYGTRARAVLRRADHCFVPAVILGTAAPFAFIGLAGGSYADGVWGYSLFAIIGVIAIASIVLNIADANAFKIYNLVGYVLMGWACVLRMHRIYALCGGACFWFLTGGCLAYSFGIVFYAIKKLRFGHAIWHMFVLLGAALNFVSIYTFLL